MLRKIRIAIKKWQLKRRKKRYERRKIEFDIMDCLRVRAYKSVCKKETDIFNCIALGYFPIGEHQAYEKMIIYFLNRKYPNVKTSFLNDLSPRQYKYVLYGLMDGKTVEEILKTNRTIMSLEIYIMDCVLIVKEKVRRMFNTRNKQSENI